MIQEIINLNFEKIDSPFQQTSSLKPYVPNVILEKIIIDLEDEVVNLLEKEKVNLETIESLKSEGFESSEKVSSESKNQSENDCLVIENECDKDENPKVIAPGMFKLNVSQCVSPISMSKSSCDSNNVEIKLKRKRRKRKSSKQNVKQVDNDVSRANNDFVHFSDLDTFSSLWKLRSLKDLEKIEFAYDYGNLNGSYVNEKINLEDDYFQEIINPDFEKIDSLFQQTSSLKPYVPNVILEKIIIDLEDEVVNLLEKEKVNLETIKTLKSKSFESSEKVCSESENQSENDCLVVEKVCEKEENSKVIAPGMFKLNVSQCVSPISMSKSSCDSKNVEIKLKRKRRETSSTYVCNDAMNVSCNPRMCDLLDDNNFFIFDDESVRISPASKMRFRKKPRDSMNVRSKINSNKSLPRTVYKWLLKLQLLAEPMAKWFLRIVQICLWIIDLGCTKHMTGNRALLTNFVEKFLGTVRFGNNDFAVIAGYGDVVIGSMPIKKVYYVEGLGHNLFSVGQFYDKVLEVAFQKSTCFVQNEDGVDLLTGDRSSKQFSLFKMKMV
uniref:Integrase, catalytic region, zinc finger, CCHC-type, peptidase aspartic, catalytic n=1 Tax=Tanacetum cinerariifolium TaxID=118510 RepID=A0A699JNT7_TANCI|nr:integrase, catalytic region, zinc finger, CCHC-type, peptidase aspartic, catalytic [Tanacetum cinerariifolium]